METPTEKDLRRSFHAAARGLAEALRLEPAFKYLVAAAIAVIAAMFYFDTSRTENAVLILVSISVLALEVINSLFERLLDIVQPTEDERVRRIKDLMAGLVLLASFGATGIGIVIFLPYFKELFSK